MKIKKIINFRAKIRALVWCSSVCQVGDRSLSPSIQISRGDDVNACVSHPPTEFSAGLARWPKEQRVMHASHSFIHSALTHSFSGRARTTLILMHDKKHSCVLWAARVKQVDALSEEPSRKSRARELPIFRLRPNSRCDSSSSSSWCHPCAPSIQPHPWIQDSNTEKKRLSQYVYARDWIT